jgi:3-oxoacyl-[acyl-carrier protein] reductase
MNLGLTDKVAIVTGSSKGIGLAITKAYLNAGVKVMMVSRDEILLKTLTDDFRKSGSIVDFFAGDVSDLELANRVINKTKKLWGRIDILINNAGGPPMGNFLEQNSTNWHSAIETNLLSVIRFCSAVAPIMVENKWGRIISISSTTAKEPSAVMVLSSTVRAAVGAFTKSISNELAQFNITANVICPGGVLTERLHNLINIRAERENRLASDILMESEQGIPAKRFAKPDEIADTVLFLTSVKGSYITGVSLAVDGGLLKTF